MRTRILPAVALALVLIAPIAAATDKPKAVQSIHAKFEVLQQDFQSGPQVTKACLTCHAQAAKEIRKTEHWTWEYVNPDTGQKLGKKHIVNNFCTATATNNAGCASCHIGYGWKDDSFDFTADENVDCLVCHDTTGKYRKQAGAGNVLTKDLESPPGSGKFVRAVDLKAVAQRVGKTSRETCGNCHFKGGGGDGVKHGDLDTSLEAPDRALDVHMARNGANFTCATCHQTEGHQVPGSRYAPTAMKVGASGADSAHALGCPSCHGVAPHGGKVEVLNRHTAKVACQTCHIPSFARGGVPTKMYWDWSTAGQRGPDGKPLVRKNADGYDVYNGIKGDFVLKENVVPEYIWFNGRVTYTLLGETPQRVDGRLQINRFDGSPTDGKSKIWPVKVFRGKQPFDPVNDSLIVTHLVGDDPNAFWTNLDWQKAITAGMAAVKAKYSGQFTFIETESTWPINHMVAPKEKALWCVDCHAAKGRLAKVPGLNLWTVDRSAAR
jgi:octaheme c-type cytochrome (tetrathionate reductase family)